MENLTMIYFYESGQIYPFLKENTQSNSNYYQTKEIEESNDIDKKTKRIILLANRTKKYLNLLIKGYTKEEINEVIKEAKAKLFEKRSQSGIKEIYLEQEALELASLIINKQDNKTKVKKM